MSDYAEDSPGRYEKRGRHEHPTEVIVIRDITGEVLYKWSDWEAVPATRGTWCLRHDSAFDGAEVCVAVRLMRDTGRTEFLACSPTTISIEVEA